MDGGFLAAEMTWRECTANARRMRSGVIYLSYSVAYYAAAAAAVYIALPKKGLILLIVLLSSYISPRSSQQ